MTPPWRPADIADRLLRRGTRPTLPVDALPEEDITDLVQMRPQVDEVYYIIHEQPHGGVQVYIWPMDTHDPQDPDRRADH